MGGSIGLKLWGRAGFLFRGSQSKQAWEMDFRGDGVALDRAGGFFWFQATAQTRSTIVGGKWYLQDRGMAGTSYGMGGPGKAQRIDTRARDNFCRLLLSITPFTKFRSNQ